MENTRTIQILLLIIFHYSSLPVALASHIPTYNVLSYGAEACASDRPAQILVPPGKYLLGFTQFDGSSCTKKGIRIIIKGTLVAPADTKGLGNSEAWLEFWKVSSVCILGGIIDGRGQSLWDNHKTFSSGNCINRAVSLAFHNSEKIHVEGLTSLNPKFFHFIVDECQDVELTNLNILAPTYSPNTDGIHVSRSSKVTIRNSEIGTGDDCISIGPGVSNLLIKELACGPGHGISIGSLGKEENEEGVQNVTVRSVSFKGTQNGIRIKTWARYSLGSVNQIVFENIQMDNVQNPIIIDQHYCPFEKGAGCPKEESGVQIQNVTYQDIWGASATKVAVKLDCSGRNPCTQITMKNVDLTYGNKEASASCVNADVVAEGYVRPDGCF